MIDVYLLLGSNVGNREEKLQQAINQIVNWTGMLVKTSSLYETEAWGFKNQMAFLNLCIQIKTILPAPQLLTKLKQIETDLGRIETIKWGPRVIDIDILFYGNEIINTDKLIVPHPYLAERKFTLEPLNEIASHFMHPVLHKTIAQLLAECRDNSDVRRLW